MSNPESLTPREHDVLSGLIAWKSYREIADDLGVSVNTVRYHTKNIYSKWRVTRRIDMVAYWASFTDKGKAWSPEDNYKVSVIVAFSGRSEFAGIQKGSSWKSRI